MILSREELKKSLKKIAENNYELPKGEKASDYLDSILTYIGDTESELRDKLIYSTLFQWIEEKVYFSDIELIKLLNTIMSKDFMFFKIGNEGDDSAFRRSFSVLLLNPIICVHVWNHNFIDREMLFRIKTNLIKFYNEEKDYRAYVPVKGWVHSIAHAADAFSVLVGCKDINEDLYKEYLEFTKNILLDGRYVFTGEEDERLLNIMENLIEDKLLSFDYFKDWLLGFCKLKESGLNVKRDKKESQDDRMKRTRATINIKNFIRSLYFRLLSLKETDLLDTVIKVENCFNGYLGE